ncbi:MAG TPA: hypothetical protein VK781_06120 [Solirubrobacteraceae bacterium]|nr:hypothetical protein [Solirubrobacteraceae bacterium]
MARRIGIVGMAGRIGIARRAGGESAPRSPSTLSGVIGLQGRGERWSDHDAQQRRRDGRKLD